jgi:hypothetical protein
MPDLLSGIWAEYEMTLLSMPERLPPLSEETKLNLSDKGKALSSFRTMEVL